MGSGEVAIVALSTMISLKVTFSDGLGGDICLSLMLLIIVTLMTEKMPLNIHFFVVLHLGIDFVYRASI